MNVSEFTKNRSVNASYAPIVRDLVKDGVSTSLSGFYEVPVPDGCNRCEILVKVDNDTTGDLNIFRAVIRERSPSADHVRALATTLPYDASGSRAVLELPPGCGLLQARQSGMTALGTMQATAVFWREE